MERLDDDCAPLSGLTEIAQQVMSMAEASRDDSLALLTLLRTLEKLHRDIAESAFLTSLPDTRHALYDLLRDIESQGGWPHIPRMQLHAFLGSVFAEETAAEQRAE
ncbi:MAG: hypothetical protein HC860_08935 [Alkalinema sp. RU_4_3]|nr:hypothetical protein [Alkalinema sp. RU_4_3]